ncbi:MAG: Uma2 family endonuclease [Anaerolineae bacterium]|nr:Uma2 family endonuclease [Anaerolineae bacterium]
MTLAVSTPMAEEAFDRFVELPENRDRLFEFIGGEILEVPSNPTSSNLGSTILGEIYVYLKQNDIGYVTGEAGGYRVSGERYAPDVAFIRYEKGPLATSGYHPLPPDLAVEVDFPSTDASLKRLMAKVVNYLAAGTTVWLFLPEDRQVMVFSPGKPVQILSVEDVLDGGDVLPGFSLPLKQIFKPLPEPAADKEDEDKHQA